MKVIFNSDRKPAGVFISLEEWDGLKSGFDEGSELYLLMEKLGHSDSSVMSAEELSKSGELSGVDLVGQAVDGGLYVSYPAGPELPGAFIHEYKNGKKVLVEVDAKTGQERFLRNL